MILTIRIQCDNDAFSDGEGGSEIARIVRRFADEVDGQDMDGLTGDNLRDINGNKVGGWDIQD